MTTQTFPGSHDFMWKLTHAQAFEWLAPIGRFMFGAIFLVASFTHFATHTIEYAASEGVPLPEIAVPVSGIIALVGSLSVMVGYKTRYGAALLVLFLVPVTLMMHRFWAISDPTMAMVQQIMFMKNVSMLGGALLLLYHGAGAHSVDAHDAPPDHDGSPTA